MKEGKLKREHGDIEAEQNIRNLTQSLKQTITEYSYITAIAHSISFAPVIPKTYPDISVLRVRLRFRPYGSKARMRTSIYIVLLPLHYGLSLGFFEVWPLEHRVSRLVHILRLSLHLWIHVSIFLNLRS
ncbi:hypothetical protein BU16DRAFT_39584 [Lophium mytilinum]|uniref:Uncharacterized protein n=1 Tax=Lophium mytilinum TaxID=390894 RepID=A0A6A6QQA7_9PEZI|nr:hypothetical protein BU16DRAFT_39584 [Lophium mytilinum]